MRKRKAADHLKEKLDPEADPVKNFSILRRIPGISKSICREVVAALSKGDRGHRTASRPTKKEKEWQASLREVKIPEDNMVIYHMAIPEIVQERVATNAFFAANLKKALDKHQNSLQAILFCDEASVGNVLRPDLERKSWCCYLTFLELECLHLESNWLTFSIVRTTEANSCTHGFAGILKALLESMVAEIENGFAIEWKSNCQMVFVRKFILLEDLEGFRASLGCKAAGAWKCCFRCSNVIVNDAASVPEGYVTLCERDRSTFVPRLQNELEQMPQVIASQPTVAKRDEVEKLLGWYADILLAGPLLSPKLKPLFSLDCCYFDALHMYWCNGLIPQELSSWFGQMQSHHHIEISDLQIYAESWEPRYGCHSSEMRGAFHPKLWKVGKDYKGTGSQTIWALHVVIAFQEEILPSLEATKAAEESLQTLFAIAQKLLRSKVNLKEIDGLYALQRQHMTFFATAYGASHMRPKTHCSLHLEAQYKQWSKVFDAFVCERKHQLFKSKVAPGILVRKDFSRRALLQMVEWENCSSKEAEILDYQLESPIENPSLTRLLGSMKPVQCSKALSHHGVTYAAGQYLLLNPCSCVQIECAIKMHENFFLLATMLDDTNGPENQVCRAFRHNSSQETMCIIPAHELSRRHQPQLIRVENCNVWLVT